MASTGKHISVVDYVVFSITLFLSAGIGIFYAYKDRKVNNMDNFHRGNRQIHPLAVSLSLSVTILSALTIIGVPAETYTHGTMVWWQVIGMLIATGITAHFFLPIFYKMDKISIFEYFLVRFGRVPRLIGALAYLIMYFLMASFVLYAPCLAFEAMTGISLWIVMLVATFVVMTYTLLGGMKAVVWADAFQFIIMVAGLVCMLVEGSRAVGGFSNAWEIARKNDRIEFGNVSFDPRTRHTLWTLFVGFTIQWCNIFGTNQATVQRACSLPSLRTAQIATWLSWPGAGLIFTLSVLNGVVMFAYYENCDPVKDGRVGNKNQIFPLMIVDVLGDITGLPGLLLACLYSGALSSISSGLNAMSAVLVEDFIRPFYPKPLSDNALVWISRGCVVVVTCIVFGVASGISQLGGLILQMIQTVTSVISGPMLGLFVVGMLFPWINQPGATAGVLVSLGLSTWLIFGSLLSLPPLKGLVVSVSGCLDVTNTLSLNDTTAMNATSNTTDIPVESLDEFSTLHEFYRMSYLWFTGFGSLICVIVALIVSFLTKPTNPKNVDSRLMNPLFYNVACCLPEKYRRKLLLGVDYSEKEGDIKMTENGYNKSDLPDKTIA